MKNDDDAVAALVHILRYDPTIAASPHRLTQALLDLLPDDPRAVRLLSLGASVGIVELLTAGHLPEAHHRLIDECDLRREAADWVLAIWLGAVPGDPTRRTLLPGPETTASDEFTDGPAETPGVPTAVRLAVWPDGTATVGLVTASGIYAGLVAPGTPAGAPVPWRRVATPQAPTSRDLALAVQSGQAVLVWSDVKGVHAREAVRTNASGGTGLALAPGRLVAEAPEGVQPRYPLATLAAGSAALDVLWTLDRQSLRHSLVRQWLPAAELSEVPAVCPAPERLRCLDVAQESERSAWLVVLTDRGRLLVAHWNLAIDDISSWVEARPPVEVAAVAIAQLGAGPTIVAVTPAGHLVGIDAQQAFHGSTAWRSVDRPGGAPRPARSLAVSSAGDVGWLAVTDEDGTWLARLDRNDDVPVVSAVRPLVLEA